MSNPNVRRIRKQVREERDRKDAEAYRIWQAEQLLKDLGLIQMPDGRWRMPGEPSADADGA
jgi:hypothetical protein